MLRPINPFSLPDPSEDLLCPWQDPSHRDLYVDLLSTTGAYEEFVREMGDPTTLLCAGRLVLVTGETGCGKSALAHWCVDWVIEELEGKGLTGKPIDLTSVLEGMPPMEIEERVSKVCDSLFTSLLGERLLRPEDAADLKPERTYPGRVYPMIPRVLLDKHILIILLPSPEELRNEVIRYAALAAPRVLFVAESSRFEERHVHEIRSTRAARKRPITLSVGPLLPGDAKDFIRDRLQRRSDCGIYPMMKEQTMDDVACLLQSIAQLQSVLSGTYDRLLRDGRRYGENDFVTIDDVRQEFARRMEMEGGP